MDDEIYNKAYEDAKAEMTETLKDRTRIFAYKVHELNQIIKEQKKELYNLRKENATTTRSISKSTK